MPRQVFTFDVSVPAGTAKAAPQVTALLDTPRTVRRAVIRVPPGPRGEVGWFLAVSGTSVIPTGVGGFIVTDNEVISWDLEEYPNSGGWELHAYNTGAYPHTIYVRLEADPTQGQTAQIAPVAALPAAAISGGVPPPAVPPPPPPPPTIPPPPIPPPLLPTQPAVEAPGLPPTPLPAPVTR